MKARTLFLLLGLALASAAWAQYRDYAQMGKTPAELQFIDDPLEIEKKEPAWWFWNKPKMDTAADQLAYAAELERAGKQRRAVSAYNDLVRQWHTAPEALYAQLSIARLESAMGNASAAYDADIYLLAYFAGHFKSGPVLEDAVAQADQMVAQNREGKIKFRLGSGLRANYERIIHFAPRWERVPELMVKIAEIYVQDEEYASAITVCDRLFIDWPAYEKLDDVVDLYCDACRRLADQWQNDTGRLKHLEQLISGAIIFRPAHPNAALFGRWKQEIYELRRARSYEKATFYDNSEAYSLEAAIRAYQTFLREFPDAPQVAHVRERLAELSIANNLPAEGPSAPVREQEETK